MFRLLALISVMLSLAASPLTATAQHPAAPAGPLVDTVLDGTAEIDEHALADLAIARARLGAQWLSRIVRPNGAFYYIYRPDRGRYETTKYNAIRHAGTTYALFQTYGTIGG